MKMVNSKFVLSVVFGGIVFLVAGCGGSASNIFDIPTTYSCDLDMPITGTEVTEDINNTSFSNDCTLTRVSAGVYTATYASASDTVIVAITVSGLVEGQSTTERDASVKITHKGDGREWETSAAACSVLITDFDTDNSFTEGMAGFSGDCLSDALPVAGTATEAAEPLTIGRFSFDKLTYF